MSDSALGATFRVSSVTHGSAPIVNAIGGNVDESIDHVDAIAGTRITGPSAIDKYSYDATVEALGPFSPIVRGTIATLTFNLLEMDSVTPGSIICSNAMAMAWKSDLNSKPHKCSQAFRYSPGHTENFAPISVT